MTDACASLDERAVLALLNRTEPTERLQQDVRAYVDRFALPEGHFVRKTYTQRPFLVWRSFLVSSAAAREARNLRGMRDAGLECIEVVAWEETRRFGLAPRSVIVTRFLPDAPSLREVLHGTRGTSPATEAERSRLCHALGELVRQMHECGWASSRLTPRNFLVPEKDERRALVIIDQPAAIHRGRDLTTSRLALIDLYDIAASKGRRAELRASERLRILLAYSRGDERLLRRLWRKLEGRRRFWHRFLKQLYVGIDNYILEAIRCLPSGRSYLRKERGSSG